MISRIRPTGFRAGTQFALFLILSIFIGTTLFIHSNGLASTAFWLFKGYLLERFIFLALLIFLVCVVMGIWAAKQILEKNQHFVPTGLAYGLMVLVCCSLFLPSYLSLKCIIMHKCFMERFVIRNYFGQVPYLLLWGLLPLCGIGVWLASQMRLVKPLI